MPEPKDKDICLNRHGGQDTSNEAHASTTPDKRESLKREIALCVARHERATCEEVEEFLGLSHQTASARISELLRENRLKIAEERGKTRSGRSCRVYEAVNP